MGVPDKQRSKLPEQEDVASIDMITELTQENMGRPQAENRKNKDNEKSERVGGKNDGEGQTTRTKAMNKRPEARSPRILLLLASFSSGVITTSASQGEGPF